MLYVLFKKGKIMWLTGGVTKWRCLPTNQEWVEMTSWNLCSTQRYLSMKGMEWKRDNNLKFLWPQNLFVNEWKLSPNVHVHVVCLWAIFSLAQVCYLHYEFYDHFPPMIGSLFWTWCTLATRCWMKRVWRLPRARSSQRRDQGRSTRLQDGHLCCRTLPRYVYWQAMFMVLHMWRIKRVCECVYPFLFKHVVFWLIIAYTPTHTHTHSYHHWS